MTDTRDSYTLTEARQAIEACLAENRAANVDRVGRLILNAQNGMLRRYLAIAIDGRPANYFNANWAGPGLADVIASSRFHREHSAIKRRAAA